ncbi:MAG: PEP-CTERM-box response regulator transcription factor [Roseibium album]|uniref:PEP-CTERM-box response regulator transcription factor n=1 Tax=Roseibium album TaxID=311410 RepID=UPI0032EC8754
MIDRRLLIIEDDPGLASQMRWCFSDIGVFTAATAREAEGLLRKEEPQVITLDLGLPPDPGGTSAGFELLELIGSLMPGSKVIVITGREEHEHAVEAIARGAYDYYQKPIDGDTLSFVVERAFKLWELESENRQLASRASPTPLAGLVTESASMLAVTKQAQRVAPTDATVLILGETGTGKEVVARAIHGLSKRADGPFAAINCAAIPENLLESELFGHEKGAFTGATGRKIGKIEAANGGTLLLDEIGDMPLPLQAKILRFLQERTVERVGSTSEIPVDVRVISATHRDLEAMQQDNSFREDLYFRIGEITLRLPPLRERKGDVILLANNLLSRHMGERRLQLSSEATSALESWSWPGNIRELENRIKRACIMADGPYISARDLELVEEEDDAPLNLKQVRAEAEREAIIRALQRSRNNVSQAARLLGISRPTLYNLFSKYGVSAESDDD